MNELQRLLNSAVEQQDVPFIVAMTANADGVTWSGAAGEAAPGRAAGDETVFRIFSMTKAIGATAAMILIDRGLLKAETPVSDILPEFEDIPLLDGFDGRNPRYRHPKTTATITHLATHTSGLAYDIWHRDLSKYYEITQRPQMTTGQRAALFSPLVHDPGAAWQYGIGIDWLGQVVEAVDGRRIDDFCREEIFEPLDMMDTDFENRDEWATRLAKASRRERDGVLVGIDIGPPAHPEVYGMGHALYSTAPDYLRFLRMFLNGGRLEGRQLLSATAVDIMMNNQIGRLGVAKMTSVNPAVSADVDLFPGYKKNHSFGFMRMEECVPGMRAAGSLGWAGLLNTHFWFDPAQNVAGLLMTQLLPFAQPRYMRLYEQFERTVYANLDINA